MGTTLHVRLAAAMAAAVTVVAVTLPAAAVTASAKAPTGKATALIMGGTSIPSPNGYMIDSVEDNFIGPTYPRREIAYLPVTTPQQAWPLTGVFRLIPLALTQIDPGAAGLAAAAWPDEPWWRLTGLVDLTFDDSVEQGVTDLEHAMTTHGDDPLVIYGYSQGAVVANVEKRRLAERYPVGTAAPDIRFMLGGDPNVPNGGLASRFSGAYVPLVNLTFNGPEPTDTQFPTDVVIRQYDGFTDFPLYPANGVALLNAVLGLVFVHFYPFDVSLADDAPTKPAWQATHGDTTYHFFETENLPLFEPLRIAGVPEPVIDVVEPVFRAVVEAGYDRTIPPWEPTPARLIPDVDPAAVTTSILDGLEEGMSNAATLFGGLSQEPEADDPGQEPPEQPRLKSAAAKDPKGRTGKDDAPRNPRLTARSGGDDAGHEGKTAERSERRSAHSTNDTEERRLGDGHEPSSHRLSHRDMSHEAK